MTFSLLYFGDVVGSSGREALLELLPGLKEKYSPDLVLANVENATHGKGVSLKHYQEFLAMGIDGMSSGDHIWQVDEMVDAMRQDRDNKGKELKLIRPANYPSIAPGKGHLDLIVKGKKVRLINLQGRVGMPTPLDSPFERFDRLMEELPPVEATIVDFHAEATSEKRCLAEYLDGRAQLVVGTHTHVPTADAQILTLGTAFITDLGMVGPKNSSLGADKSAAINSFLTGLPWRYTVSTGGCELGAIFCQINFDTKQAEKIEHLRLFSQPI
jgi:metallophosphoesterase (TIGR00282 family)